MSGEGAQRLALALVLLVSLLAPLVIAAPLSETTEMDTYDGEAGCYYNFQHYGEGDRIMTNEPCLNCTCHNRMLMCYLRVCPFTKPIGQDCTVEKRGDQCCPVITCPDVPVDLLTSTTQSPSVDSTEVGHHDNYGCSIDDKFYSDGAQVPSNPNKPCELCYCIRNMTACVMQECTLHVEGCTPVYNRGVCCPVRYSCDHPEEEGPLMLDDMTTTVKPTPGFMLTTTFAPGYTMECTYHDQMFADGALISTDKACEHCYCMKGDIVCAVQECGTPMENEGKNCTALAPKEGQCCPETYVCDGEEPTTSMGDANMLTTTQRPVTEGMDIEEQKPEIESHIEQKPESEHKPEIDGVTEKSESSTNIPQSDFAVTTETDKSGTGSETATEHGKPESESATEHSKPELESTTEHKLDSESVTEHGKPESDSATEHKLYSESVTEDGKPSSESSTEHKLDSEGVTEHGKPESESTTEHKLNSEGVTEHDLPDSESATEHKLDSEGVTKQGKPETESTTEHKISSEGITEHDQPESESATEHKPDSADVTKHGKPELESATEHKLDSEIVTEHDKISSESTTEQKPEVNISSESSTTTAEVDDVTENIKSGTEVDEEKPEIETSTDNQKPESVSGTETGKPTSEESTEKVKSDSESVTEKLIPDSGVATEDTLGLESSTKLPHDEVITHTQKPSSDIDNDTQTPKYESATKNILTETEMSTVTHDLEAEHEPSVVTEHGDHTTSPHSDSETVTEKKTPDFDNEIEGQKPEIDDRFEDQKPETDSSTEEQKPELDNATENIIPETVTSVEKKKPESDSQLEQKPEVDHKHATSKPKLDDESVPQIDLDKMDEQEKPEVDHITSEIKPESEKGATVKPDSEEEDDGQKSETDNKSGEQKPETGHDSSEKLPELEHETEISTSVSEQETESQEPQLEDNNTTLAPESIQDTDDKNPDTESATETHKLDSDDTHTPQTPDTTSDSVPKDDAHKPDETAEEQHLEEHTQISQQEEESTGAEDVQTLLTTVSSVKLDSEEKTTVKSIDVEQGTEDYVTKTSDADQSDDQTTVQSVERVTPVRDYKDDNKGDEDVPKQDVGATKVPQHRDEHLPEYLPTESEKDQSHEGTTEAGSSLITEKTISETEKIETDDKAVSTESVLHEGHDGDVTKLPSVTDSITAEVTTTKYKLEEGEQTTVYDEKESESPSEKPLLQENEHITDMPDTIVKESSSKLPLDSVTEIYQSTAHKDLDETKPNTTEQIEDDKTTDSPVSQGEQKLPHDVVPEIEPELTDELTTVIAESDIVQKTTESSVDISHEGSGSELPEISDEKVSESSTKMPALTTISMQTTVAPKDTTVDYTKYPIIDSESDLPDSHTEIYKDSTSSPASSSQTTESSITDQSLDQTEKHHINNEVTEKSDIDDIFSFTTVKTISDSTEGIHDRYQTDSISDTQDVTDKTIESSTQLSHGEKDTDTVSGEVTTIKLDVSHSAKDDLTTAVPIIEQHEEGSGDEAETTTITADEAEHHIPEKVDTSDEKIDHSASPVTEQSIPSIKDITHQESPQTTEKSLEKTTIGSVEEIETEQPGHADKPHDVESSSTDKSVDSATEISQDGTDKPEISQEEPEVTTPLVHSKPEVDELENEIGEEGQYPTVDNEPSRIPGEGDCLVDGTTYRNNSPIPTSNKCQSSCRCVNSIIKCDHVQCSPPPADMVNCQPVYHAKDNCCPMYTCEHVESVTIESDNHMGDITTLSPQETTVLSAHTTQAGKDHDGDEHGTETSQPGDDISQATQSPKETDEQKIIPVLIDTDETEPQDKLEVHETPITPNVYVPDCGSNGCSPDSKLPVTDKSEIDQVTEPAQLDISEGHKKPIEGESTEKDSAVEEVTTVIYEDQTEKVDDKEKPVSIDTTSVIPEISTELPHKTDGADHTAVVEEITTPSSTIISGESTTAHPEIPHDKVDLEDDIGQNTIKPEDESAVGTTEKVTHPEHVTEKVSQELPDETIKDDTITTVAPNQDSHESDDTSSEVDTEANKDSTEKLHGEQITEGPAASSQPGYEYSTPLNKLDDSEITFISTTSKTIESELTTPGSIYDQKTDKPLVDSEAEIDKVPSDSTKKPHSDEQMTVKPVTSDESQDTNELNENISTVQYDQDKESSTESTDTKKSPVTDSEETVEHATPQFETEASSIKPEGSEKPGAASDKPDESDKSDEEHVETSTITQADYTSSPVLETELPKDHDKQHPDGTQHKDDSGVTDASVSQIDDQATTKYIDDSSSTKEPLEEDNVIDELTTKASHEESDQITIRPVVVEVTDVKKPSSDVPSVEEPTESSMTELGISQTTVKSNIQHTDEEPDNSIEEVESDTKTPLETVTIQPFEHTTLKSTDATTVSSDDVNKIGVSVLPTDMVDEDCGSAGCSQNQPQDSVTSQTPIGTDSQEKCGPHGCQVEAELTRVPVDKTTELPNEIDECTSEECKLSQSTPPKAVDSSHCGPEGCEHDDQQNVITDDDEKSECGPNGCPPGSKPHAIPSEDSIKKESDKDGQCGAAGCGTEESSQSQETTTPHVTSSDGSTLKESDKDGDCGLEGCDATKGEQPNDINKPTDSSVSQNASNESGECTSPGCLPTDVDQSHSTSKPSESTEDNCDGVNCGDSQITVPIEKADEKPEENKPSSDCQNGECSPEGEHVTASEIQTTSQSSNITPVSDITEKPEEHVIQIEDCGPQGCGSQDDKSTNVPEIDVEKSTVVPVSVECNGDACGPVSTSEKDIDKSETEKTTESSESEEMTKSPLITDKPTKISDQPQETDDESKTEETSTLKSDSDHSESTPLATESETTEKTVDHKDDCNSHECLVQGEFTTPSSISSSEEESSTSLPHATSPAVHLDAECESGNCATDSIVTITEPTDASPSDEQKPVKESDSSSTSEDTLESTTTTLVKGDLPSGIDEHGTTVEPSHIDSHTEKSDIGDRFSEDDKITEHEITTLRLPTDEHVTEIGSEAETKPESDSDKPADKHTTLSPKEPESIKPHVPSTDIPVSLNVDDLVPVTDDEHAAHTTEFFVDMPEKQTLSPESHILEKDSDITTQSSKDATQSTTELGSTPSDKTEKYPNADDIPVIIDGTKLEEQEVHTTSKPAVTESASKPQDSESITTESYVQTTIISKHPDAESTTKFDDGHESHETKKPDVFFTSEDHEVTDLDRDTDFTASTVPSYILQDKLKPTVPQEQINQSTDASVKDQSPTIVEEDSSTLAPAEESYKPTDKPLDVVEKSTLVPHQEQETDSPIHQNEEHIPHSSEKDSAESATEKSEEGVEESVPHTTGASDIVKETPKPELDSDSVSGSTTAPESSTDNLLVGKDTATQKPEHVDHSTYLPESQSEEGFGTEHPEQSDVTLKPASESQEDTDQSSEEIEDNVNVHATSVKPILEVTKTAETSEGIIKTTEKTVDDKESSEATEKNISDVTDKPEHSEEQETTEKEVSNVTDQSEPSKDRVSTEKEVSDITEKPEPSKDQSITEKVISDVTDKPESGKDQETTESAVSDITEHPEHSKDQETTEKDSDIAGKPEPSKDEVTTEKEVADITEKPEPSKDQSITEKAVSDVTDQPELIKDQGTTEKEVSDITEKPEPSKDKIPTEEEVHDTTDKQEPSSDQVTTEKAVSELTEKPEPSKDQVPIEVGVSVTTDEQEPSGDQVPTEKAVSDVTDKPEPSEEEATTDKKVDASIQEHDLGEVTTSTPDTHETKKPVESDDRVQTTDSPISEDKTHSPITDSVTEGDGKTGKPIDDSESSTANIGGSEKDVDVTTHYPEVTIVDKHDIDVQTTQKQPDAHSAVNITETPNLTDEESGSTISPQPAVTTIAETIESHTESLIPSSTVAPVQHELTPANDTNVPSSGDDKIVPSLHDRYPETESSTDDISQAELPALPTPDQDEDHQVPQIPDFAGAYPSTGTDEQDYEEEDQPFGPGTCRYGGKVYVSAQQIPRDDPCDFCFCFRSDIICLQQSCPPPIQHCHEEPISGFCCPRYECPVSMATVMNVTTTTTTTTTTLPPHFLSHAYKGAAQKRGCQIKGQAYKVGDVVRSASGPCLHCTCGGDGQMKCDPKVCTPEPMLRQMIAVAATTRRR